MESMTASDLFGKNSLNYGTNCSRHSIGAVLAGPAVAKNFFSVLIR